MFRAHVLIIRRPKLYYTAYLHFHYSHTGENGKHAIHSEVNMWSLGIFCNVVYFIGINMATVWEVN